MKKIFFLSLLTCNALIGQNGLTTYPLAAIPQVNFKTALTVDISGNTWVGFRGNNNSSSSYGIGKFDGASWTVYNTLNTLLTVNSISALATQYGNIIWAGAGPYPANSTGELVSFDGTTWTNYTTSINANYPLAILAENSNVWVGTKGGLYKYDGLTWTNFTVANSGLASDTVLSLAIDPSGNILAGTQRGLSIQNGIGWTNYTSANISFPSNKIVAVYSDAANGTWLSTDGKAGRFAPPYYTLIDSMAPTPSNVYPTACLDFGLSPNGGVMFSGNGCLIEVHGNNNPVFYYYNRISGRTFLSYNPVNAKTWIVNQYYSSGPALGLHAFDGTYTHALNNGVWGSMTYENCKYLDVNYVRTTILNRGDKSWNLSNAGYEVPKGSGAHTVFASALWIGGLDNGGGLHQAAMTYRQTGGDFWPGPLDTINGTADSATAGLYDRIWSVTKTMIQEFQYYWSTGAVQNGSFIPDDEILSWPAHGTGNYSRNLAPFVDVDGNGIYNPLTGGDYPAIKGDQMLYCIYNDNLATHGETGALPLKVEVHASAYAYFCPSVADSQKVVNYTTYYNYEIFNRSGINYNDTYIGLFHDVDLGFFSDDFVGCLSQENFSFVYNGDANDGSSPIPTQGTYGAHPPITSVAILDGPIADPVDGIDNDNDGTIDEAGEKNLMTGHTFYNNDFTVTGNPDNGDDYYLYTSGYWKDSTIITYGGTGYGGVTPEKFMFDGLPYDATAWTEISVNNTPYDRRAVTNCGPFTMNAGQHVSLDYAIVYSRDTTLNYGDTAYYDQAVYDVRRVRNWYNTSTTPSCVQWNVGIGEPLPATPGMSLYPNPASTLLTIEYKNEAVNARYEVLDLTGRVIETGPLMNGGQTTISVEDLPTGIYLVRILDNDHITARKFIRQ